MAIGENTLLRRTRSFLDSNMIVCILLLVALVERLAYAHEFGLSLMVVSDSMDYYESGLMFARTGRLCFRGMTTAFVMPGTTVLIGLLALIFEEGESLMWAIQLLWILMGTLTPLFMYKAASVHLPRAFALLAFVPYLMPIYVGISNYLLTEGPFYLFFAMSMYYLFMMEKHGAIKYAAYFGISLLLGMMFRANILMFAGFGLIYMLLQRKYELKQLVKMLLVVAGILMLFILPWSIRNYYHYQDFIPVTYGMGNPVFEGTYFGDFCPVDDQIDMNIPRQQYLEEYAEYLDENGKPLDPDQGQYLLLMEVEIAANYRISQWLKLAPMNFLKTYLFVKPRLILNWEWYYQAFLGIGYGLMHKFRLFNCLMCAAAIPLCLITKKLRKQTLFLGAAYGISLLSVAYALPIDRYAETIMPYRFLMACFSVYMAWELWKTMTKKLRKE